MIYLDTSAAMKLVRAERHSDALSHWLAQRSDRRILSSVLIAVELTRATRRSAPDRLEHARQVLAGIATIALTPAIVARAADHRDPSLRSLDAIHLATAADVEASVRAPLEAFVAYDTRLLTTARATGLPAESPGLV